jgi:hypothetical protein
MVEGSNLHLTTSALSGGLLPLRGETRMQPLRTSLIWQILEEAKANGDAMVIAACRRLITADRLGWTKHRDPQDWALVKSFIN